MTEDDISTPCREWITVNENNDPDPDNVMQYDDALPTPSPLIFGFHGVNPWRQSFNFPVARPKLNMTPIPRIQHMSHLDFFMKFYLMKYIKDVVIPETNKRLKSSMNLNEYFRVIGCRFIMDFYVGHYVRDFFLKDPITPQKGSPIHLNHIISGRRIENITQVMSYKNLSIPDFNDNFLQQSQINEGWNKSMAEHFDPS